MRYWRNLASRLSVLVALAVLLVLFVVGVYFDEFLRHSFQDATAERMMHAYQRLGSNLSQIEYELDHGTNFAQTDERLIASTELINRYENPDNYNTFLIDEEKKSLAQELLSRVKLSFNHDIALYGQNDELIAFASRLGDGYQLGYVTRAGGALQIKVKSESHAEYTNGQLPANSNITLNHYMHYTPQQLRQGHVITYHRSSSTLVVKAHQSVFDQTSGRQIAHLELSRLLDAGYFKQLSEDLGLRVALSFEPPDVASWANLKKLGALDALRPQAVASQYLSVAQLPVIEGVAYFQVALDKSQHTHQVNTNRLRFLLLQVLLATGVLLLMRQFIRRTLTQPLGSLMDQIRSIERGDYLMVPPVATGDELEAISTSINKLATAVQEREKSLERARNEQEFLSNHDALTGLPNRRFFAQRLEHALDLSRRQNGELAVFFLDLDQFKLVNDTLGHHVGDELLVQVAQRLQAHVRSTDTLARIGGDEFNVLIEQVRDVAEVEIIVGKYLELFREPFLCAGQPLQATVSIGIAMYPRDGTDSVSLLKHADLAVYKSKESGRDAYSFYSQDLSLRARRRAELIHALNQAIQAGDQFALVYQPKVSAQTGRVVSAEALIRWNSPQYGLVSPAQFVPLAEETGQIVEIGAWVIRRATYDLAHILAQGVVLNHMSVNVSNVQLRGEHLKDIVCEALERNRLQPQLLELEITESYIARDARQAITALEGFRAMGLQLAIDDFGTGYSSMSYLHKLPFTRLKIDKSFIDGLPHNQDNVSITRAILALAKNFGLAVTAEGVEHAEQVDFLRAEGCNEIQGYHYAKPMPLVDFLAYCTNASAASQG